jgi:gluconokinase
VILIVAGVSGSGKTTVGALLAGRLRWRFADADTFHPEANLAKMRDGVPLTDADREPWLRAITDWMDERLASGESGVITCSALKRAYRDRLLNGRPATMVFLEANAEVLEERLRTRPGHFFPEKLLNSQLSTLELPAPDEKQVHVVASQDSSEETAALVMATVWPAGEPLPDGTPVQGSHDWP